MKSQINGKFYENVDCNIVRDLMRTVAGSNKSARILQRTAAHEFALF